MDLYASAVGTTCALAFKHFPSPYIFTTLAMHIPLCTSSVLQVKELPSRPLEYDGLLNLGDAPEDVSEAEVKERLQSFGEIEYCKAPEGTIVQYRVKFARHCDAEKAAAAAKEPASWTKGICKWAAIAYDNIREYGDRGW